MEFLLYLTPIGNQIINNLAQAKFKIQENTQICRNEKDVFGYLEQSTNKFVICTSNIKNGGWNLNRYVNETVYHEAVHAAQDCKSKGIGRVFGNSTLGIPKKSMPLSSDKLNEVKKSSSIFNLGSTSREHEAYFLENKPEKVLYYVKKYCL
jgi:hypothetical protein